MTRHVIKKAPPMDINEKRRVRKRISWQREDVDKLFEIWGQHLRELGESRRNAHVYQKMSDEMNRAGVNISCEELRVKINNVTQIWRREKRLMIASGQPSEWDLFDAVDKLLASCKTLELTTYSYIDDSASLEDVEELQSISSDFEMTKHDRTKECNRKISIDDQNDDIEKMLRQIASIGSSSRNQPEFVAVKNEVDADLVSNASTPLASNQNQDLTNNRDKENPLENHISKQSEQSVSSSQNMKRTNKESINSINRDDEDEPRRPKLFRLKKFDLKRTSNGARKNLLNKETIFNLKQEKLALEIEHLKKINCKVDLQIERARLENRLLSLKVKRCLRSYTHFS